MYKTHSELLILQESDDYSLAKDRFGYGCGVLSCKIKSESVVSNRHWDDEAQGALVILMEDGTVYYANEHDDC